MLAIVMIFEAGKRKRILYTVLRSTVPYCASTGMMIVETAEYFFHFLKKKEIQITVFINKHAIMVCT